MAPDQEEPSMHGDQDHPARAAQSGERNLREAMRESADSLRAAVLTQATGRDRDLAPLSRIHDLQAEVFRLREALSDAVGHGDESFYRVLDLQEELRQRQAQVGNLCEQVRGLQEEAQGLQEEVRGLQEEIRGLQEEIRGLQEEVRGRDARIDSMACMLDAANMRGADQQARYEADRIGRDAELAEWQAYAAGIRGVAVDMMSSHSWRFTWILRALSATLRGRKTTGPALPDAPAAPGIGHDGG